MTCRRTSKDDQIALWISVGVAIFSMLSVVLG